MAEGKAAPPANVPSERCEGCGKTADVMRYTADDVRLCYECFVAVPVEPVAKRDQPAPPADAGLVDALATHLTRQRAFSAKTFGPGERTAGVLDHIRKELAEIEREPSDVTEWIDVVILAFDGAWRSGHEPREIAEALVAKQTKNESRAWPDWRTAEPGKAIEHVREAPPADAGARMSEKRFRALCKEWLDTDDGVIVGEIMQEAHRARAAETALTAALREIADATPDGPLTMAERLYEIARIAARAMEEKK